MGVDFIRKRAKSFKKAWDGGKNRLAEPTLFTEYPECRNRTVVADLSPGCKAEVGTELILQYAADRLVVVHQTTQVGAVPAPPADLEAAIRGKGGCALGHVVSLNSLSGTANVEVE